jgi:hypothetical protein
MTSAERHVCSYAFHLSQLGNLPRGRAADARATGIQQWRPTGKSGWAFIMEPSSVMHVNYSVLWSTRGLFVCLMDRRGDRIRAS